MKRPWRLVFTACLALVCSMSIVPCFTAEPEMPVLAQDLKKLRAPGKVGSVLWTRRSDQYTLQIVFPRSYRILSLPASKTKRTNPTIQVWLLRADGTLIAVARRTVPAPIRTPEVPPDEVLYSIPLPAGQEAVAVALMVDNDYYIEELKQFVVR